LNIPAAIGHAASMIYHHSAPDLINRELRRESPG
jgi:hypothetical protein